MENRHKRLQEQRYVLREGRVASLQASTGSVPRGAKPMIDTARYLGVILNTRITWLPHIVQVRKKAAQKLGLLVSFLHRRMGLSIRNGVLLYKQLIRPMMDYA